MSQGHPSSRGIVWHSRIVVDAHTTVGPCVCPLAKKDGKEGREEERKGGEKEGKEVGKVGRKERRKDASRPKPGVRAERGTCRTGNPRPATSRGPSEDGQIGLAKP